MHKFIFKSSQGYNTRPIVAFLCPGLITKNESSYLNIETFVSVHAAYRPGVDFINVLRTAFTLVDPKSVKKNDNLTVFLLFWDLLA